MGDASFIEGIGLITAKGGDVGSAWNALLAGETLSDHGGAALLRNHQSRVVQLAARAVREAVADAGWDESIIRNHRTALLVGTSKGPIDEWLGIAQSQIGTQLLGGVARLAEDLAADLKMIGPRETWSAACASGLYALRQAQNLLRRGDCDHAIVVAAESSLHPLFIATFDRLGVLARPGYGCRPFDQARDGFVMSEAAAAVCLSRKPKRARVTLERVVIASDAYHITGIDPTGNALRHILKSAAAGEPIDFVHAHGTATDTNDPIELAAIEAILGDHRPHIFSHKAAFGHTQGAAGLIAVVTNACVHRESMIPPNTLTAQPIAHHKSMIVQQSTGRTVNRSVAVAAGFGGSMACAALKTIDR